MPVLSGDVPDGGHDNLLLPRAESPQGDSPGWSESASGGLGEMPLNHSPACRAGTASMRGGVPALQAGRHVVTVVPGLALRAAPWAITWRAFSPPAERGCVEDQPQQHGWQRARGANLTRLNIRALLRPDFITVALRRRRIYSAARTVHFLNCALPVFVVSSIMAVRL